MRKSLRKSNINETLSDNAKKTAVKVQEIGNNVMEQDLGGLIVRDHLAIQDIGSSNGGSRKENKSVISSKGKLANSQSFVE